MSASHPGRSLPPVKTRYPLYRRLDGPQGRSGQVRKISPLPPPGFDPWTVQPVASRYTDQATRPTTYTDTTLFSALPRREVMARGIDILICGWITAWFHSEVLRVM